MTKKEKLQAKIAIAVGIFLYGLYVLSSFHAFQMGPPPELAQEFGMESSEAVGEAWQLAKILRIFSWLALIAFTYAAFIFIRAKGYAGYYYLLVIVPLFGLIVAAILPDKISNREESQPNHSSRTWVLPIVCALVAAFLFYFVYLEPKFAKQRVLQQKSKQLEKQKTP